MASWQHCIDYNTTKATPAAQVMEESSFPPQMRKNKNRHNTSRFSSKFPISGSSTLHTLLWDQKMTTPTISSETHCHTNSRDGCKKTAPKNFPGRINKTNFFQKKTHFSSHTNNKCKVHHSHQLCQKSFQACRRSFSTIRSKMLTWKKTLKTSTSFRNDL